MAAAMKTILLLAVSAATILGTASSVPIFRVGRPGGAWDLTTDYGKWASTNTFHPGDGIVFDYQTGAHDVLEVTKANYDSCNATSPIANFGSSGFVFVFLPTLGPRYFICGFSGHCTTTGTGSMKLKVDVVRGSSRLSSAHTVSVGAVGLVVLLAMAGLMA